MSLRYVATYDKLTCLQLHWKHSLLEFLRESEQWGWYGPDMCPLTWHVAQIMTRCLALEGLMPRFPAIKHLLGTLNTRPLPKNEEKNMKWPDELLSAYPLLHLKLLQPWTLTLRIAACSFFFKNQDSRPVPPLPHRAEKSNRVRRISDNAVSHLMRLVHQFAFDTL